MYGIAVNGRITETEIATMEEAVERSRELRLAFGGRARVQPVHVEKFLAR